MKNNSELLEKARTAKKKAIQILADLENVCGVGITKLDGKYAIKVNLSSQLRKKTKVRKTVNGFAVVYHVVGKVKKQSTSTSSKAKPAKRSRKAILATAGLSRKKAVVGKVKKQSTSSSPKAMPAKKSRKAKLATAGLSRKKAAARKKK